MHKQKKSRGTVNINKDVCKGCLLCIDACPQGCLAVSLKMNKAGYFPVELLADTPCTGCSMCYLICPEVCIEVYKSSASESPAQDHTGRKEGVHGKK